MSGRWRLIRLFNKLVFEMEIIGKTQSCVCDSNLDLSRLLCFMKLHDWPWIVCLQEGFMLAVSHISAVKHVDLHTVMRGCALKLIIKDSFCSLELFNVVFFYLFFFYCSCLN